MYDDDPAADLEALYSARLDADLEMAEMAATANHIHRLRKQGICTHQSSMGYVHPPVYEQQKQLKPGEQICTDLCGRVFPSIEAMEADAEEHLL
ncbi:hypothetical protein Ppa06_57320 [Planomonospora parontospora subsp. parontospora]|uniref:Uncharacterized protein n=2 Tax=Planomonospora parontospora TaxID=58119 RepID=A0AA37F780_9ACTN|nr:hypothetical protein [Planomonospora parontospora]GGK90923.1 hypothetical protein GCM10010126_57980 [Planomonospora parontospora]GII11934.1 hypothetical protein Ppa06_57320 [Planomonospora parontospora subsp. parontospora]